MCAQVCNQRSSDVVIARVRTDVVRSLRHQCRDLHQSTYPIPLGRLGLILLSLLTSQNPNTLGGLESRISVRIHRIPVELPHSVELEL
jgi:hypothetical protein